MSRSAKLLIAGILACASIAPIASARTMFVGRGGFYGSTHYGPAWYGWYAPAWTPYGYSYTPNAGSVKIDTKAKDASVYVDGGYAGTVGRLKTFRLQVGEHDIDLRGPAGHSFYQEKVTVLAGKTLTIRP